MQADARHADEMAGRHRTSGEFERAEVMAGPPLRIARTLPASSDSGPTLMRRLDESPRAASGNRTTNAPARAADKSLESESSAQVNAAHKAETAQ
jgi:hypothetical protein